jgi:macrolide transport system ATP-binding/permease protein
LLGSAGLYGVVSYSVGQRIREIGIRIALRAQRSSVYGLVLRESAWPVALGAVGAILCSLWMTAFLRRAASVDPSEALRAE